MKTMTQYLSKRSWDQSCGEHQATEDVNWSTSDSLANGRKDGRSDGETARVNGDAGKDESRIRTPFSLHLRNCRDKNASSARTTNVSPKEK